MGEIVEGISLEPLQVSGLGRHLGGGSGAHGLRVVEASRSCGGHVVRSCYGGGVSSGGSSCGKVILKLGPRYQLWKGQLKKTKRNKKRISDDWLSSQFVLRDPFLHV